ncbi:XRE family transcriptional regulator [Methylotenera sp.]|uniref:XRE family transcriptional regulator n=1 Tax=Methylotenera sp. TaxID=2051956 RepID=UPI002ED83C72
MSQAQLVLISIALLSLILIPGILLINYFFKDTHEILEEISELKLEKSRLKLKLLCHLNDWINSNNYSREQVISQLSTTNKIVTEILDQRVDKFTVDKLIDLTLRTGQSVDIITKNKINKKESSHAKNKII